MKKWHLSMTIDETESKEEINMPANNINANVKLGKFQEPIDIGDWCFHENYLCRVLKINAQKVTLLKLFKNDMGKFGASRINVDARNIFIIAKDIRDMPQYLKPKVDAIDRRFLEETSPKF